MKKKVLYWLLCCIITTFMIIGISTVQASNPITIDMLVYSLFGEPYSTTNGYPWGAHEGIPHGVPSNWSWYEGASGFNSYGSNTAMTTWGHVYEWAGESPVTNIRIHIRNMKTYAYYNGQWNLIEEASDNIGGSWWKEDYSGSDPVGNVRTEPDGGISFTMVDGYNYHWWSPVWPRPSIPTNAEAFYTTLEIRLIPNTDPNVDLNNAKYLANVSWDWYTTPTSSGPGPWPSVGIGRFRWVKPYWQTLSLYVPGNFQVPSSPEEFRSWILSRPLPPGVTDSPAGDGGTYIENFDDNQAQDWSLSANVSVANGKMSTTNWVASTSAIYNGKSFSAPYTYKIDMYGYGGSTNNKRCIVFNYADNNNYYFVEFTGSSSGSAALKKKVNGTISTIASYGTYATANTWVTVEISYADNKITVKATKSGTQTTLFNNVSDSSLTSGKIGVMTEYDNADFDNVTVTYSTPAAWIMVDDNDSRITYSGTWGTASNSNAYGGSWRYSNTANNYAEFTFTGTGVRWISSKNTDHGIADIYIDGVKQASVDGYASSQIFQQVCYEKIGLPYGAHTIKVVVTNSKNSSSTGYYHDVDAFAYTTGGTYVEDFNDNQAQDWSLSANVSVANGKMSTTNWAASTSAFYNGKTFSAPYTYKIDMYGYGTATNNKRCIVFNYVDNNNYYFVEFTGGSSGTATLKKKVNGAVSTIASYGIYATNGTWVTVEITYAANSITVKATKSGTQTTLFTNVSDSSLASGKIGVMTEYDNADFDNVMVTY